MVFMPNRSTPDYWFEKAEQCFRRSRIDSNVRDALEALGNAFMVKAVELDIKLQKRRRKCRFAEAIPDPFDRVPRRALTTSRQMSIAEDASSPPKLRCAGREQRFAPLR
jgi:hypothetical protein